jgi:hypothetical protein
MVPLMGMMWQGYAASYADLRIVADLRLSCPVALYRLAWPHTTFSGGGGACPSGVVIYWGVDCSGPWQTRSFMQNPTLIG